MEKINIVCPDGEMRDLANVSKVVGALKPFRAYRVYARDDSAQDAIEEALKETLQ